MTGQAHVVHKSRATKQHIFGCRTSLFSTIYRSSSLLDRSPNPITLRANHPVSALSCSLTGMTLHPPLHCPGNPTTLPPSASRRAASSASRFAHSSSERLAPRVASVALSFAILLAFLNSSAVGGVSTLLASLIPAPVSTMRVGDPSPRLFCVSHAGSPTLTQLFSAAAPHPCILSSIHCPQKLFGTG